MLANVFFYRSHARARSRSGGNMGTLPATLEAISSQARPLVASEVTRVSPSAKRWFIRTRRGMGRAGVAPQAGAPYGAMPGQQQVGSMGGRRTDMAAIRAQQEIMDVHHSFGGSGGGRPPRAVLLTTRHASPHPLLLPVSLLVPAGNCCLDRVHGSC